MARKLLITGATGFVGQHVVRRALDRGFGVRALVRRTSGASVLPAAVERFTADLTDATTLAGCCDGVDGVVHTACAVAGTFDAGRDVERRFLEVNRDGTLALARQALAHRLRFVHTSSTAAMGTPTVARVDETAACFPRTPYQVSKREAELGLLDLHRKAGLDVVILRPCLVAGEGKAGGELLKLFRLVGRGVFPWIGGRRDLQKPLIAVDDLAAALLDAVDKGRGGEIYLLHSDGGHTLGDIIDSAGRLTGARRTHVRIPLAAARLAAQFFAVTQRLAPQWNPPLTPERVELFVSDRRIDISKARRELGFEPRHQDLDELLGRTYRYYATQGLI